MKPAGPAKDELGRPKWCRVEGCGRPQVGFGECDFHYGGQSPVGLICQVCGNQFEAVRRNARFCSVSCRKTANRRLTNMSQLTSENPNNDRGLSGHKERERVSGPVTDKKGSDGTDFLDQDPC